jgi:hypothetical protein
LAYTLSDNREHRRAHDILLAERAERNYKAKETPLREKIESFLVSKAMRAKAMLGRGINKVKKSTPRKHSKKKQTISGKSITIEKAVAAGRLIPIPQSGRGLISILSAIAKAVNLGMGVRHAYKGIQSLIKSGKLTKGAEQQIGSGLFLRKSKRQKGGSYSLRVVEEAGKRKKQERRGARQK